MANNDYPRGLVPYGEVLRANIYSLVTSVAAAVYHGDMMETTHASLVSKYGNYTVVEAEATGDDYTIVGGCLAIFDHNFDPVAYIAASETGDGVTAGYVLVADHPDQLYVANEDGDGGVCGIADAGQCADMVDGGGNTSTGRSVMEIDSSTVAATATLALQLMNPCFGEDPTAANCDWICKINAHFTRAGIAGV